NVASRGKELGGAGGSKQGTDRRALNSRVNQFPALEALRIRSALRSRTTIEQRNNVGGCRTDVDEDSAALRSKPADIISQGEPIGRRCFQKIFFSLFQFSEKPTRNPNPDRSLPCGSPHGFQNALDSLPLGLKA